MESSFVELENWGEKCLFLMEVDKTGENCLGTKNRPVRFAQLRYCGEGCPFFHKGARWQVCCIVFFHASFLIYINHGKLFIFPTILYK